MFNTFKYTLLWLLRTPGTMLWALLFPLVLASVFIMMFGPLDDQANFDPIPVVAVESDDSPEADGFATFMEAMGEGDDEEALFAVTWASNAEEAIQLLSDHSDSDNPFVGYVQLVDGTPQAFVTGNTTPDGMGNLKSSILVLAMNEYAARAHLVTTMVDEDPAALSNPEVVESIAEPLRATIQIQVTESQPKESTRFYYALLGMAALFGGGIGLITCQRLKANTSALGARRSVGGTSHIAATLATLLATWLLTFCCLTIAYGYMRFVGQVDFGNHSAECLIGIAAASLVATSLGCAISAIPHVPESGKDGILTGIVCFASFFAGLYGQPTMHIADTISANFPLLDYLNPAAQISQMFYAIMYYDTSGPFFGHVIALLVMAAVLFTLSANSLRRRRYASL